MHISDLCTSTILDFLFSIYGHALSSPTLWTKCSILQRFPRSHLNVNAAKTSQSQRTSEDVSDACLHLPHSRLFTRPSFCRCPFYVTVSYFIAGIYSSWVILQLLFSRGSFKQVLRFNGEKQCTEKLCYKIAPLTFLALQLHLYVFLVNYSSYSYNIKHILNDVLTKYCLNRLKIHDTIENEEEKLCMGLCMCFDSPPQKKCHWRTNDMNICIV